MVTCTIEALFNYKQWLHVPSQQPKIHCKHLINVQMYMIHMHIQCKMFYVTWIRQCFSCHRPVTYYIHVFHLIHSQSLYCKKILLYFYNKVETPLWSVAWNVLVFHSLKKNQIYWVVKWTFCPTHLNKVCWLRALLWDVKWVPS